MDVNQYIASGILELYVAGTLSDEENMEVYLKAREYPEIQREIEAIEASILTLGKASSPEISYSKGFYGIKSRIGHDEETIPARIPKRKSNWIGYSGWAASVLFAVGLVWSYTENNRLKSEMDFVTQQNQVIESQVLETRNSLASSQELLRTLRAKNITVVFLEGQEVSPTSFAKAYWNREGKKVFIDALGLPDPPDGMVYQVWSLKLNPLIHTNIGLLEDFTTDENKVFALTNPNESEAFGITLESAGGNESPTLEQLYALGTTTAS